MTEREKNGERLALQMSRHRQAKHESLKDEDVKTAYIKGCEDTAKENAKARALLKQWLQTTNAGGCGNVALTVETADFIKGAE